MDDVLLPLLIFGTPERRRAELTEQLLPAAVPGTMGQRVAFAAVIAQQQISNREEKELKIVKEAATRFGDAADLAENAPTINTIYTALPEDVRKTIEFGGWSKKPADRPTGSPKQTAEESVGAGAGRAK
jgi:hypothetical protein